METINASMLAGMFLAGAKRLEANKDIINELNVFPVPDGDTGTNMSMTIESAAAEVRALQDPDMKTLCKAISSGSLRGARGNSGVILSQILRGFTKVVKTVDEIDAQLLAEALGKATDTAYRAVMKPKEGTILTVQKGTSDLAADIYQSVTSVEEMADELVKRAELVLDKTPELLPVLKEAGVVDSGGRGLLELFKGAADYLCGREVDLSTPEQEEVKYDFLYDVSVRVLTKDKFNNSDKHALMVYLETIGEEIEVDSDIEGLSIHMQTNEPGRVLTKAQKYGELLNIAVSNKSKEDTPNLGGSTDSTASAQQEKVAEEPIDESQWKEMGFVTVSIGEGLNRIFKELGADVIIEGGQTMNPSTEDILDAIEKVPAHNVFILPNNKNILLAASQASEMIENKRAIVIPSTTIPHGISALINFIPDQTPEENKERMIEEMEYVKPGEVTYAVRDTQIDNKKIKAGDYMGIGTEGILSVNKNLKRTISSMIKQLANDETSLLSVYYGADVSDKEAEEMCAYLVKTFPDLEVEMQPGNQPVYFYILSVE